MPISNSEIHYMSHHHYHHYLHHHLYTSCASIGNLDHVNSYLTSFSAANINYTDIDGYSALLLAAKYGHLGD